MKEEDQRLLGLEDFSAKIGRFSFYEKKIFGRFIFYRKNIHFLTIDLSMFSTDLLLAIFWLESGSKDQFVGRIWDIKKYVGMMT